MPKYICHSLDDTARVAKRFAQSAKEGTCIALCGDLGCGKTTFSRFFIRELNPDIEIIPSPTFNIVQSYPSNRGEILHVDCYRLQDVCEIRELGLLEAFCDSISLIEWPEIIQQYLPDNCVYLHFTRTENTLVIEQIGEHQNC